MSLVPTDIDHVGLAVRDLEAAVEHYRRTLGIEPVHREHIESDGVEEALFKVGSSYLQLLAPTGPDTPVGKFIEKRGEGVHHVGYRVDDVATAERPGIVPVGGETRDRGPTGMCSPGVAPNVIRWKT